MMEALLSSKTSVRTRTRGRNIPEDGILHSHRRETLRYVAVSVCHLRRQWERSTLKCIYWRGYRRDTLQVTSIWVYCMEYLTTGTPLSLPVLLRQFFISVKVKSGTSWDRNWTPPWCSRGQLSSTWGPSILLPTISWRGKLYNCKLICYM
jgi:hypothetical protein